MLIYLHKTKFFNNKKISIKDKGLHLEKSSCNIRLGKMINTHSASTFYKSAQIERKMGKRYEQAIPKKIGQINL